MRLMGTTRCLTVSDLIFNKSIFASQMYVYYLFYLILLLRTSVIMSATKTFSNFFGITNTIFTEVGTEW